MNQIDFFKCLSDTTRLDILRLVMIKQNICVCELTEYLKLSQPKISRHLALLRNHAILLDQRQGQWVYYRLNPQLPEWGKAILHIIATQDQEVRSCQNIELNTSICCE